MRPLLDIRALKSGGFLISFVQVITEEKKREGKGNDGEEKKGCFKKVLFENDDNFEKIK